jgi:hypothetical protein
LKSATTSSFRKCFGSLPPRIQARARAAYVQFNEDPAHPSLHFKKVHDSRPIFSARVSLGYRALAVRADNQWIWFWIGSHADYDKLLKRL